MFTYDINSTRVVAFNTHRAAQDAMRLVAEAKAQKEKTGANKVLIIDVAPSFELVAAVAQLKLEGFEIHYRDHHLLPSVRQSDANVDAAVGAIRALVGADKFRFETRSSFPSCAGLVAVGEFEDQTIFSDIDLDGAMSALRAAGIDYPDMVDDAAQMDGAASRCTRLSPLGELFYRSWYTIRQPIRMARVSEMPYEKARAEVRASMDDSDRLRRKVIWSFIGSVKGSVAALNDLTRSAESYQWAVERAKGVEIYRDGFIGMIHLPDGRVDMRTICLRAEGKGCRAIATISSTGSLAKMHGEQVTINTCHPYSERVDLRLIVGDDHSLESGVLSHAPFRLTLSYDNYNKLRGEIQHRLQLAG